MTTDLNIYPSVIAFVAAQIWKGDKRCNAPPTDTEIAREMDRRAKELELETAKMMSNQISEGQVK